MNKDLFNFESNNYKENISTEQLDSDEREMNEIIDEYIQHPDCQSYIENFKTIKPICEEVLKQKHSEIKEKEWSRNIGINDAIKYAHQFLTTIDSTLADQFINLVYQNNNNQKTLNILPNYIKPYCEKGKAYIYYHDKIENMITLLHEMIHAMGYSDAINTNSAYRYLRESPTLIIESLFSKWLVKNKIITQNDYNKYKKWRLQHSKGVSCKLLIEKELIDMKLKKGLYITRPRVIKAIERKCHIKDPKIFSEEESEYCYTELDRILMNKTLKVEEYQRYVIGQYIADKVENSENPEKAFLRFHNFAGNVNLSSDRILRIIKKDYQQEDIDR